MVAQTRNNSEKMKQRVGEWKEKKPQVTEEETKDMLEKIEDFDKWFDQILKEQEALSKFQDPVLKQEDVNKKFKGLKKMYTKLNNKKKPAPPKEPKKDEE
jgi:hypoxia up-regulated 1